MSPRGTLHREFTPVSKHNIKTDHITNDPPVVERPFQKVFDKILTKPAYSKNEVSSKGWAPFHIQNKSMNNRSSVNHNIVTHQDNNFTGAITVGVLDKKVTNKKKGIGEMTDLCHLTAPKTNKDYAKAYHENPRGF